MKTILLFACAAIFLTDIYAQDTWVRSTDFSGNIRIGATGFSIGAKGYLGTGTRSFSGSGQFKDFWEFDTSTGAWTSLPDFGGGAREGAVGFSIGNKGFIGLGFSNDSGYFKSLWEYDPVAGTWAQKASFPSSGRSYATVFVLNNKAYINFGQNGTTLFKDVWEYDPALDKWTSKNPFPGEARVRATGFAIGAKGYLGTGFNGNFNSPIIKKDFWEYDPVDDGWTQKTDFGGGNRHSATSFAINGKGYVCMGASSRQTTVREIWSYTPQTDTWVRQLDFPSQYPAKNGSVAFTIGNEAYLGTGYLFSGFPTANDFWEYSPCDVEGNAGDPSVFGDNVWNVYAWNSGGSTINNQAWNVSYRGYYVDNSLNFNSQDKWNPGYSPSYAPGYIGCPVIVGNHSWSAKRKGFDCGYYSINVTLHYGSVQLFVDSVKVWEDTTCCNSANTVWEGYLGAGSKIEFRLTVGPNAYSAGAISLTKAVPVITAGGSTSLCTGESVVLTSSYSSGNQWYKDGLAIDGATGQTYVATQTGAYTASVVLGGCPSSSLPFNVTVTTPAGDPSVFGDNKWNVYAWNEGDGTLGASAWQNNYRGYYTDTTLYAATRWYTDGSPSEVAGYQGCSVQIDHHSWSAKRKGFPCGQYRLWIVQHSDAAQLFIDGNKVWEHDGCCDQHDSAWQGYLNADSRVEFRGTEGSGTSIATLGIYQIKPVVTISGSNVVCSGFPVTLTASPGMDYVWSNGESTRSISVSQPGNYTVSQTDNCGNPIPSNPVTIIALAAPGTIPTDTVDLNLHNGTIKATGYFGNAYKYKWYKTGETTPVADTGILTLTKEGDYYATVSRDNCTSPHSKIVHVIDPIPFGDNIWYVHYFPDYSGDPSDPNYNYYGYYPDSSLSFDTRSRWGADSTPAFASGYQGLEYDYEWDNFKFLAKRKGFPCGHYKINIPWHDDNVELWINDILVFAHYGCCDGHPDVWEGDLGPNSTVELKVIEYYGNAIGAIEFELMSDIAKPAITPQGPVNICSLDSLTLTSSAANGNVWSTGDTTQSITVHTAGSYSVVTSSEGCTAQSDPADVTVTPAQTWYADMDHDGYGDPASSRQACTPPPGYVNDHTDCNDNDSTVHAPVLYYIDTDHDGYGSNTTAMLCSSTAPSGYATNNADCDDTRASINPGAPEICDGLDNNCNGDIDEGVQKTWYRDADGDGYGDPVVSINACKKQPGYVANSNDCNDANPAIGPGTKWYRDADNDGYYTGSAVTSCMSPGTGYKSAGLLGANDCDDNDNTIYPKAPELCDGKDNNCNGTIDEKCPTVAISVDDVSMNEGNKGKTNMTFTISLSAAATKKVTVQFATSNGTASAGSDYEAKSGTITFSAGITKQIINISIIGDKTIEAGETFVVNLSSPVNALIAKGTGTGTIINDDGAAIASVISSVKTAEIRSVKISPTPANSNLRIELSGYTGNVTLQLISMQGRALLQKKIQTITSFAKEQIDVSGFSSGTYLLAVIDDKGNMKTEKVIISH